jgi:hypothetical protein
MRPNQITSEKCIFFKGIVHSEESNDALFLSLNCGVTCFRGNSRIPAGPIDAKILSYIMDLWIEARIQRGMSYFHFTRSPILLLSSHAFDSFERVTIDLNTVLNC